MALHSGKEKSRKKIIIALVIAAAAAITLILFLNFYYSRTEYYKEHFFEGTVINGTDVSDMTAGEVKGVIQDALSKYTFTFTDHEGRESTVTAEELSLTYIDDGAVDSLLSAQDSSGWITNNGKESVSDIAAGYTYDRDRLASWITSLPCLNDGTPSTDAFEQKSEDGYLEIVPETYGDKILAKDLTGRILSAVDHKEDNLTIDYNKDNDLFIHPEITADNEALTSHVQEVNDALDAEKAEKRRLSRIEEITDIDLKFNSYIDKVYINQELLKTMLTEDEKGNPAIDEKKFKKWVGNWAKERGFTENTNLFVTHGGRLMQVNNGPFKGWSLDLKATAEAAWKAVQYGDSGVIHPVCVDSDGKRQTRSNYIEINIMKQKMWLYVDGEQIVATPVVTGNVARGMATPSNGVWHIDRMNRNYTMVGADYVAYCDYWMAFNGGIGIHDLASRTAFGGDIYKTAGSHGCVNTPYEAVKTIYGYAYLGLPVVVHS